MILVLLAASTALAQKASEGGAEEIAMASGRGKVVVFASERLGKDWIQSFFNTIGENNPSYNQCEISLNETLSSLGFEHPKGSYSASERRRARQLKTAFGRYNDMSAMANDIAVKASRIVDPEAGAVVLCTVEVGAKKKRWSRRIEYRSCAQVRCKAVSTFDARRMVTHSMDECAGSDEETRASLEAISEVCSEAGRGLGAKLIALDGGRS